LKTLNSVSIDLPEKAQEVILKKRKIKIKSH